MTRWRWRRVGTRPYGLNIPGVISLRTDGPENRALAMHALERIGTRAELGIKVPAATAPRHGSMLHASTARFLKDVLSQGHAAATQVETKHSLELFRDVTDDVPVADLASHFTNVVCGSTTPRSQGSGFSPRIQRRSAPP